MTNKISTRRYGRLLTALYLKDSIQNSEQISVDHMTSLSHDYINKLEFFLPNYQELPEEIKKKILKFSSIIISSIQQKYESLIDTISQNSRNRTWNRFLPLDKALLLIGVSNLEKENEPLLIIKEILIISDLMQNQNAAPYLSGILKSIAFPQESPNKNTMPKITNYKGNNKKIKLKSSQDTK